MSKSHTKSRKEHLYKYRKNHKELDGVPQSVTFFQTENIRGYRIINHPKCKCKQFASSTIPVDELKKRTLSFLKKCEHTDYISDHHKKVNNGIPKGIIEQKPGKFLVCFTRQKIRYTKFFSQKPRQYALKLAIEWMKNKKKELINGNGSETK